DYYCAIWHSSASYFF
nr:immunoglobulin light chain junction region [Macaca mulatta]MOV66221.1 immunoglobulin light chain junction region [Macaca mulatta]MOV66406.1 immunoglobulin light chain junction region [Macaca mulatta]MOV66411.1 immunoglobulin light chain junction region [Macaca mulatta]MOV66420.1 immunoglobulin light chain junction region [Macaca mulatta]